MTTFTHVLQAIAFVAIVGIGGLLLLARKDIH